MQVMNRSDDRGCNTNCFFSSNSVMDFFFNGGQVYKNVFDSKNVKPSVKCHSILLKSYSNRIDVL